MTLQEALARTCCTLDTISDDTDPKQGVKASEMQGTDDQEAESFWQMANVTMWLEDKCIHAHHQVLSQHSSVFAGMYSELKGSAEPSGDELKECLKDVPYDSMKLLVDYMYANDKVGFIRNLPFDQLEKAAHVADRFGVKHFLQEADNILHGKAVLSAGQPEAAMGWLLLAERNRCLPRLQARCEAFLAGNFAAFKTRPELGRLGRDVWMRLMYASSYTGSSSKETILRDWIQKGGLPYTTPPSS